MTSARSGMDVAICTIVTLSRMNECFSVSFQLIAASFCLGLETLFDVCVWYSKPACLLQEVAGVSQQSRRQSRRARSRWVNLSLLFPGKRRARASEKYD